MTNIFRLLGGQADAFSRSPHHYVAHLARSSGGLGRFRLYNRPAIAIDDVELAREVLIRQVDVFQRGRQFRTFGYFLGEGLLSTDGPSWRSVRQFMEPGFRTQPLAIAFPTIKSVVSSELTRWQEMTANGNHELELMPALQRLTARLITEVFFSLKWDDSRISEFSQLIDRSLQATVSLIRNPFHSPSWWPLSLAGQLHHSGKALERMLEPALQFPREDQTPVDLITLWLQQSRTSRCPLSRRRWLDELKTLAVAAFETSTTTLTWTIDLLARHPEEFLAIQQEIDSIIGQSDPSLENLYHLSRCEAVLLESMRLWPAVHNVVREARQSTVIGGHHIVKGTLSFISIFGIHRHPDLWEQPNDFVPARFINNSLRHTGFFPFSTGPHICLGSHLAMLQIKTVLVLLCQRFELISLDQTPQVATSQLTLRPCLSPHISLRPRR